MRNIFSCTHQTNFHYIFIFHCVNEFDLIVTVCYSERNTSNMRKYFHYHHCSILKYQANGIDGSLERWKLFVGE